MRNRKFCLQSAVVAVIAFTCNLSAQTWQTVDDYVNVTGTGTFDAAAQAMAKDPSGNIYAAGYIAIDSAYDTVAGVRKSSDGGATWSLVDAYSNGETAPYYEYNAITSDAGGHVYGAGDDGNGHWFVRRSADAGQSWSTTDFITGIAHAIATDSSGNVFALGQSSGSGSASSWVARKSADGGNSWETVDSFNPGGGASARGVFCHPTAGILTVGLGTAVTAGPGNKTTTRSYWYVRRSQNGGATWTTVDSYPGGTASAIGADASGNIYVTGNNSGHWIVRASSNGGSSWATVDDYQPCVTTTSTTKPYKTQTQCYNGSPTGFAADISGNLFVAGLIHPANQLWSRQWVVRKLPIGGSSWQTVDNFQYLPGTSSVSQAIIAGNSGDVLVCGWGEAAAASAHWLVRKFPAP